MGAYLEALKSREAKIAAEGSSDKRKQRGGHSYSLVVTDCFAMINDLVSRGDTLLGIFNHFRDGGTFDENAEYKHFFNAIQRERKRRGIQVRKNARPNKIGKNSPVFRNPVSSGSDGRGGNDSSSKDSDSENSFIPRRDRKEF